MTNRFLLIALLLTAATPVMAQEAVVHTQTESRVARPLAIDGETNEVKPAIQRFLERINMARVSLAKADSKQAQFDLDEAEKHLNFIKGNSHYQEISKQTTITSGQVVYDQNTAFNSYYVPIEEGPVVVKDYVSAENQAGEGKKNAIAVKSAKVVYLTVDLSGPQASDAIAQARAAIKEGDLARADETLSKFVTDVTVADAVQSVPKVVAQDNLKLASSFLQENNYVAARFALDQSIDALKKITAPQAAKVAGDVSQIRDLVMQETENTTQKARAQLSTVQKDVAQLP